MQSLLKYNTFHLPACARVVAEYSSIDELQSLLETHRGDKILPIGSGSDILFTGDFDGVVLVNIPKQKEAITIDSLNETVMVSVPAGVIMDEMIARLVEQDITGMENLSHIPGTVGGAVVQNAGAYGVEIKDVITSVHCVAIADGSIHTLSKDDCRFGYRDSIFKHLDKSPFAELGGLIITSVDLQLKHAGAPTLTYGGLSKQLRPDASAKDVRNAVIRIRQAKLPDVNDLGSAGSFFTNPVVTEQKLHDLLAFYPDMPHYGCKIPCAWLIEQCGLKGARIGDAKIYPKQPLVIVNMGKATAEDILTLANRVVNAIRDKFGIIVQPEVNYV